MPCYEIRTVSVEFKVANFKLLKQALEENGYVVAGMSEIEKNVSVRDNQNRLIKFDLANSKVSSQYFDEKELATLSNQIKRAYSKTVIDELARKNKWIKKQMGENRYQLQRF